MAYVAQSVKYNAKRSEAKLFQNLSAVYYGRNRYTYKTHTCDKRRHILVLALDVMRI